MEREKIKEYITKNFIIQYKTHQGLNSVKLRYSWFINNKQLDIFNEIIKLTDFLGETETLSERLYCIMHDVSSIGNCPYCNNMRIKYANYTEGYRRHCGNRKCNYIYKAVFKHPNGLTSNQQGAILLKEKLKYVGSDGMTIPKRRIRLAHDRMKSNISPDGISQWDNFINKIKTENMRRRTTLTESGITLAEHNSRKAAQTMKNTICDNGKTILENRIIKGYMTKCQIDASGLDGFEKAFHNGAGNCSALNYKGTNLYYQGSHELHFLDLMTDNNLISFIKRGYRFDYTYQNKIYRYHSDFIFKDKIIIEIKSNWSYGKYDIDRRICNHAKFKSVLNNGMILYLVFDRTWFLPITNEILLYDNNLYDYTMFPLSDLIIKLNTYDKI